MDALLDRLHAGEVVDLVAEFGEPLSVGTLAEFTGLPREDSSLWIEWERRMFDVRNPTAGDRASQEMSTYILGLIAARKQALDAQPLETPANDFIGLLLQSEVDGHRLTDREVHAFLQLQFGAGFETTADAISVTLHYLATHPGVHQQLAEHQELLPHAVEEFLRYVTPIQIFGRNATHDLELHGQHIQQGDVVAISYGSANHDPDVFKDPATCILDRFADTGTPRHLTFGAGVHLCLGAPVSRLELGITLREFTTRVPPLRLASPINAPPRWKQRGDRRGLATLPVQLAG